MAETYITDEDRYVTPRVSQGNAYEDVNTRAAANLGTMNGQMTLLKMQELQNSVSAQDLGRRKAIFEEDQRSKKQAEVDDFSGFLAENAEAGDINKMAETYARRNPNIFNNEDAMQTLGNLNKSQARMNQIRTDAMEGRNLDFQELHEKEQQETFRIKFGTDLDKAKVERDAFKAAIFDEDNNAISKVHSLLGGSSLDPEQKKLISNAFTDLKSSPDISDVDKKEILPTFLRLASSFSGLTKLEEIQGAKISQHGNLINSLAQGGIKIDLMASDDDLDKTLIEAIKKHPERAGSINKFRNDFLEARTSQNEIKENKRIFNEKMTQLNELSKKSALGDVDSQIERKRLLDEMAISAGSIEGKVNSAIEMEDRKRKRMDEDADRSLKSTRIMKYEADIANSRDDQERKDIEMKYKEAQADSGALESARDAILDELDVTTDTDRRKELEKSLSRITNTFKSRSSSVSSNPNSNSPFAGIKK